MTLLTALEVADYWIGAGGPRSRAVEWVAIALGESGLNTDATSPAGAAGLWQIMPFNAPPYGYAAGQLYDPHVNAVITVAMSGGGVNCAAWDSAYLDIYNSGRYRYLAYPEDGSADWNNIAVAAAELAGHGMTAITAGPQPDTVTDLGAATRAWQKLGEVQVPAVTRAVTATTRAITSTGRRGWRP